MAARILLTPEELESEATKLETAAKNNQDVITKCDNIVKNLLPNWEGQAQSAFQNSWNIKKKDLVQMTDEMNSLAKQIKNFATRMKALESQKTAQAQTLANC